jgi:hypothetical protein
LAGVSQGEAARSGDRRRGAREPGTAMSAVEHAPTPPRWAEGPPPCSKSARRGGRKRRPPRAERGRPFLSKMTNNLMRITL